VFFGPYTFNFQYVAEEAVSAGAARRFANVDEAMRAAFLLLADTQGRAAMSAAGLAFAAANRGATARTMALIDEIVAS